MQLIRGTITRKIPINGAETGELFNDNYVAPTPKEIRFNPDDILNVEDLNNGTSGMNLKNPPFITTDDYWVICQTSDLPNS